jgi:hypothetical protein
MMLAVMLSPAFAGESIFVDPNTLVEAESSAREADSGAAGYAYRFTVDQSRSQITVTARVLGQDDSDQSPVTGRLNATLEPGQGPFSTIHITDMDLELTEQIDLSYRWFLLGDGWVTGTGIGVDMNEPGPQTSVEADDSFVQQANLLGGRGTFAYKMPPVGEGEADLSDMGDVPSDLAGLVRQDQTTITLQLDIDIEYPLEIEGTQIGTAWVQGSIVATAEVFWRVADLYGDGFVNFLDFAVFAWAWSSEVGEGNYDPGCEMFEPADGVIDARDLAVFAGSWLAGIE